jgi:hypothetical protein
MSGNRYYVNLLISMEIGVIVAQSQGYHEAENPGYRVAGGQGVPDVMSSGAM